VILLLDGDDERRTAAADALQERGLAVLEAARKEQALHLLGRYSAVDLLVCAMDPSTADGIALARLAQRARPGLQVLLLVPDDPADERATATAAADLPSLPAATAPAGLVNAVERLLRGGELVIPPHDER
jgi:DNA-binding NtrC family response regulator